MTIGIIDIDAEHIYWCETQDEARDIKRMLNLVGVNYQEIGG